MQNSLIIVSELATQLKLAESTVYNWIQNKSLPEKVVLSIAGTHRIRRNVFEEYYKIDLSEEFLTIVEVAKVFNKSENTVRSWLNRKDIPEELSFKIVGTIRVRKTIFDKYISGEAFSTAA